MLLRAAHPARLLTCCPGPTWPRLAQPLPCPLMGLRRLSPWQPCSFSPGSNEASEVSISMSWSVERSGAGGSLQPLLSGGGRQAGEVEGPEQQRTDTSGRRGETWGHQALARCSSLATR